MATINKVLRESIATKVKSIVELTEPRVVVNGKGKETVYTHRMYLQPSVKGTALSTALGKFTNEAGKALSFGAMAQDGTIAIDMTANEVGYQLRQTGMKHTAFLAGADYEASIVVRPAGTPYVDYKTGESKATETTHVARESETLYPSARALRALIVDEPSAVEMSSNSILGFGADASVDPTGGMETGDEGNTPAPTGKGKK